MRKTSFVGGALAFALLATTPPGVQASHDRTLVVDVALDARTFTYDRGVNPFDSNPPDILRGDTFIVNGTVYRGGTIPRGEGVFSPDEPGAIGAWLCRGVFLVNVAEIGAGAPIHVNTTQLYQLRDGNLVTEGLEGTVTVRRAVTGGTGRFAGAVGQVKQEVLGSNSTGLFNIRLTFTFKDR